MPLRPVVVCILIVGVGLLIWTHWDRSRSEEPIHQLLVNTTPIMVEIADTDAERERGLSGRSQLNEDEGMFFVFLRPGVYPFWMQAMQFSIDIIWIGADHRVSEITRNVSPESFPTRYEASEAIQYVLEANAGWAEKHDIRIGDTIRLE